MRKSSVSGPRSLTSFFVTSFIFDLHSMANFAIMTAWLDCKNDKKRNVSPWNSVVGYTQ